MKVTKFDQLVKHLTEMSYTPWEVEDNDENFEAFALRDFVLDERRDEQIKNKWLSLLGVTDVDSPEQWILALINRKGLEGFDNIGFDQYLREITEKPDEYPLQNI